MNIYENKALKGLEVLKTFKSSTLSVYGLKVEPELHGVPASFIIEVWALHDKKPARIYASGFPTKEAMFTAWEGQFGGSL